jgi:hypothetical protein
MWEQLNQTDIERVKQKLVALHAMTLRRHEEELKALDVQRNEVETLERLAEAVVSRYLQPETSLAPQPTTRFDEQPTEALAIEEQPAPVVATTTDNDVSKPAAPEARQDAPPPALEITQQVSPNFGIPLRRFVGR